MHVRGRDPRSEESTAGRADSLTPVWRSSSLATIPARMIGLLYDALPPDDSADSDELLRRFLDYVAGKGLTLYPAQEEANLGLFEGKNVILNTPTGSGISLVASDPRVIA
jgi:superfamily II RNA helicase